MDERTEMRIHVGDNARTLRGVEQVGGWFLRADKGLKMIPGDVRDLGNTYQADLVVVRPGCAEPAPRRPVPGRGRQDHLDQPDARSRGSAAAGRVPIRAPPRRPRPRSGTGIVISSPILILSGFLICLLAAMQLGDRHA